MAILRKYLKYLYRNLLPERLRMLFDLYPTLRAYKTPDGVLTERKIMILAPHPDDEIIGCGGTIHYYHLRNAETIAVFMTDGRRGKERYKDDELVAIRREEAKNAAAIVGIDRMLFMDNKDSELTHSTKTTSELVSILNDIKPEAVFLPFLMDGHPDHITTNHIFFTASKSLPPFMCYAYCVWTPLSFFNLNVDITPYIEIKRKALEEYKSQMKEYNYVEASLGLAKYYSIHPGGRKDNGWSEAFFVCKSDEYRNIVKAADWFV